MKPDNLVANAEISIHVPVTKVWHALTNPALIKKYMFGTTVTSDWHEGSEIMWEGEFNGKPYKDHGVIQKLVPNKHLQYSHTTGANGTSEAGDTHIVDIELTTIGNETHVALEQDHNANEKAREESEKNWNMMLESLKEMLEQ